MKKIIKFIDLSNGENKYPPKPSSMDLPNWYKDTKGDLNKETSLFFSEQSSHYETGSIKKCIPVLDIISSGYLLYTSTDLIVTQVDGIPYYQWYGESTALEFHPKDQASLHPLANTEWIPKWINTWGVKTEKGYSCLFLHPQHREDLPFITLSGIIDTDKYTPPVQIVFSLKDPKYEGLIPAGTPICQIVPFKREYWKSNFGSIEDINLSKVLNWRLRKLKNFNYKHQFWSKKFYK